MSRGPRPFTQTDVQSALKAALRAGLTVRGYEIDKEGKIKVATGVPGDKHDDKHQGGTNQWDEVLPQDGVS